MTHLRTGQQQIDPERLRRVDLMPFTGEQGSWRAQIARTLRPAFGSADRISNYDLMMLLINFCRDHSIGEILDLPDVRERVDRVQQELIARINADAGCEFSSVR